MLPQNVLLAVLAAMSVSAVPLNINLGAYSPALVVGDGEISFGGAENAGELIETLATGAAANAGQQQAQEQPQQEQPAEGEQPPQEAEASEASTEETVEDGADGQAAQAIRKGLEPGRKLKMKRDLAGFREALQFARDAQKDTPKIELGTENAGVGILQNAGTNVDANSAANGAKPAGAKRSEQQEERSEKQGITLLAIAEI